MSVHVRLSSNVLGELHYWASQAIVFMTLWFTLAHEIERLALPFKKGILSAVDSLAPKKRGDVSVWNFHSLMRFKGKFTSQ